ncbi:peptidyl-arginine deiminase [Methanospirillum lacunae]|uniref:Peptidyl-arginine deiminase n=2 Tax=Methanospirillum lacunae TaxID=668570 RepID=A0A2V2MS35_9EURY|nr:peptidyl-arginine deiminase [Methanospirillum lacunae]
MESRLVMLGLIQASASQDPDENLRKMTGKVSDAISSGARIICLPELYRTQYFPQYIGKDAGMLAETIPGESTRVFSELAKQHEVVIIVPIFEYTKTKEYRNAAVIIDVDGSVSPPYYKVHVPQDPSFFEKGYFAEGNEFRVVDTRFGKIAVLICYDQWFPEAARAVALAGAEIIFYPTAIGDILDACPVEGEWQDSWETIQRSHAIANSVHVAAVNRVGTEDKVKFFGGSFVADAFGSILARAGSEEEILLTTIDLSMNRIVSDSWGFIRNRRPETYGSLCTPIRGDGPEQISPALGDTPRNRGFHMPAEWEHHEAVWISWPHNILTFPFIEAVEESYILFIRAVHISERICMFVPEGDAKQRIEHLLFDAGVDMNRITLFPASYSDVWIRDYGPTFLVNRGELQVAMVRWIFNAWGDKYDELLVDGAVPGFMNDILHLPVFSPGIVLEGGSIDVNGRGTVLTTHSCLLNPNRNPSLSQEEIEQYLLEYLGAVKVIWLGDGVAGDDTDGHIDDIARFVDPCTVLCAVEEDPDDENYAALQENYQILCNETDQDGNPLTVIPLPMPQMVSGEEGRYPASYTNFYIGNSVVIVPVFGDPGDEVACNIIRQVFPDREIIGINARAMIEGYGTFHCATQQQPCPYPSGWRKVQDY